jgi:hypothetical protein
MAVTLNANTSTGFIATSDTSGVLQLQTAGTTAVTVDASQRVGIGLTPNAWSGSVVLQMTGPSLWGSTGLTHLSTNTYFDGSNYKYIATNFVTDAYQLNGAHVWRSAASGTAGTNVTYTATTTLNANGVLALSGASTSADGTGITFPATQSASSNANTLDDYEYGNYTSTITNTGGTITVTSQNAQYVKVGRMVNVSINITLGAPTTSGNLVFSLPFALGNSGSYPAVLNGRENAVTGSQLHGYTGGGSSTILTFTYNNQATAVNGYNLLFSVTYYSST